MISATQKQAYQSKRLARSLTNEIYNALVNALKIQPDTDYILFLEDFFKQYIETLKGRVNPPKNMLEAKQKAHEAAKRGGYSIMTAATKDA